MSKDLFKHLSESTDEQLLAQCAGGEPFCVHGLSEDLKELFSLPILKSFKSLKENWKGPVDVHLPDVRDEASTVTVSTSEAFDHFQNGQSVLFNDVNNEYADLNVWLEKIRENLKLSVHTFSRSLVYGTPAGGGNAPHFDQNINFVIQVHGEKKWWLAKNKSVVNPLGRHVIGEAIDKSFRVTQIPCLMNFLKKQL